MLQEMIDTNDTIDVFIVQQQVINISDIARHSCPDESWL